MNATSSSALGWGGVVRLGLVQASIGAVVVLMTSTINRVMIVELGWAAAIPGALVTLHFAVQLWFRPRMGMAADLASSPRALMLRGMGLLALSGTVVAFAVGWAATNRLAGLLLATVAFAGIGVGVSSAGTPLLALLAQRVAPERRARAAAVVWLMMIAGFILTTVIVSHLLEPFSYGRLTAVTAAVCATALLLSVVASYGIDIRRTTEAPATRSTLSFVERCRAMWDDRVVRQFCLFIFCSMLGYSAQDLILEPFAGTVFQLSPAASTRISSLHQGGMLIGMLVAAAVAVRWGGLTRWAAGGCIASGLAFVALAGSTTADSLTFLKVAVFALGCANGAFAIGAIGSMMLRARGDTAGLRMGLFGAAQAGAYAIGGFLGALGSDIARAYFASAAAGYAVVFLAEAVLFVVAAGIILRAALPAARLTPVEEGTAMLAGLQ